MHIVIGHEQGCFPDIDCVVVTTNNAPSVFTGENVTQNKFDPTEDLGFPGKRNTRFPVVLQQTQKRQSSDRYILLTPERSECKHKNARIVFLEAFFVLR